jgi:hypothetical protein
MVLGLKRRVRPQYVEATELALSEVKKHGQRHADDGEDAIETQEPTHSADEYNR